MWVSKEKKEDLYVNNSPPLPPKILCNSYFFNIAKTARINQRIEHLEVYIILTVL